MSAYKVNCSQMHIQSKVQATKWKLEIIWFKVQNPYACLKRLWYYMIWLKLIDLFFLIMVARFVCCSCKGYTFQRKDVPRKTCALIYYPFIYSGNPLHNYYLKCTSIYMWKWYSWLVLPHFECDGHENLTQVCDLSLVLRKLFTQSDAFFQELHENLLLIGRDPLNSPLVFCIETLCTVA